MKARALVLALALALFAAPSPLRADAEQTARRAAEMLEQAGFALMEADGARDRVEALTATVRAYEEGLLALREGLRQAVLREQTILTVFEAERDRLARLLGVLQGIESSQGPVILLHPEGPLSTARAGMIVADVTPAVAREAAALRAQLNELALMRDVQTSAIDLLTEALANAQAARSALSQAIADRVALPPRFVLDQDAMRDLVDSVDTLDAFATSLAATATLPDTAATDITLENARGSLPLPVIGTVLRRFGEADAAGVARPGLVLATRPAALVTAPWPSSVRYAGPLLDYGNVVILEPEANHLLVLAGLGDLYVRAGQLVGRDAPVGLMPSRDASREELITPEAAETGGRLTESLYMELRVNAAPVDPQAWFAPAN